MKLLHFVWVIDHVKWLFFVQRRGIGGAKAGQKASFRVILKYFELKKGFSLLNKTSNYGNNISDTLGYASCATFLFLPHFDVICDLLLNRRTVTWNLFIK